MRFRHLRCVLWLTILLLAGAAGAHAQGTAGQKAADRRFVLGRGFGAQPVSGSAPAPALAAARQSQGGQARVKAQSQVQPNLSANTQQWQPLGPFQVQTPAYGLVTGRISSLAVDGSDASGSTVYVGATGGGVWKSSADPNTGRPVFRPLTDNLPAFQNAPYLPAISVGALSLNPNNNQIVLAGTGDPNNALDSYYGAGILRSTDGGNTWTQIYQSSDTNQQYSFVGAGFAGFAWSTATANLVVAAVSQSREGQIAGVQYAQGPMAGLYYSTDAGQTWKLATITDGTNQVVQSSSKNAQPPGVPATSVVWNRQRGMFLAALRSHGYYSSTDGITWTRLAHQPGAGFTSTCSSTGSCPINRGVLAVQPATGDTFALTVDRNNIDQGLFQDVCSSSGLAVNQCNTNAALLWGTQRNTAALEDGTKVIPEADYNLALAAVPSGQDTLIFAGTQDIFRCSLANSCTWRNTTNTSTCGSGQVAPSVHAIDGALAASGLLYFGTDGGLWRTVDALAQTGPVCSANDSAHFDNLNGGLGSLAEVSHLAVTPSNGSLVLGGLGALGVASSASGTGVWQQLLTGEGSYVAIDPDTPANWFADAFPGLGIYTCPNGAGCTTAGFGASPSIGRAQVENDTDYLLNPAPWILDPGNPTNILLGTCRMWLGPASGGWTGANLLSAPLDGAGGSFCDGNAAISAVGAGGSYNAGGEHMYAGMESIAAGGANVSGHLFGAIVPQSGGVATWTDLWRNPVTNQTAGNQQFNPSGGAISSIAIDPSDAAGKTVYVGIDGFPQGQGGVVYRSPDGGATWANITNTLVVAPVNKVVVDPGNPNYVYVAGDFGVYWTNNVANCIPRFTGFQNCWAQLAAGLPNAPVTDLQVVNNGGTNALIASTYGRGIWALGLATSPAYAQASLSPGNATFDATGVGTTSPGTRAFTLINTGSKPLIITQVAASPATDYAQANNCGSTLATNAGCTITVSFKPSTTGDRPGALAIYANTQSGRLGASLDGTGQPPGHLSVSPASLTFPTTATGSTSAAMTVSVTNDGGSTVQLNPRTLTGANAGEFALGSGSSCGSSLSVGATCTVPVVFQPANTGTRTATLNINGTANSPMVSLSGNAVLPPHLVLNPSTLNFEDTGKGNLSNPKSITLTNTGGAAAQLGSATISPDYQITADSCGASLSGNQSCSITIVFSPTQTGSRSGLLTQPSSNIPAGQVTAPLNGTGLPPPVVSLSPSLLDFGSQQQGTSSTRQITIKNTGGSAAQFTAPGISGDADFALAGNTCGSALGPGATCTISIQFTPSQPSQRPSGLLMVPYGSNGPSSATLNGAGTTPAFLALSPNPLVFPATADNAASPAQALLVRNTGQNPAALNPPAVTGPFALASTDCPAAPQTLAPDAACSLNLTFTPPGAAAYTGQVQLAGAFSNSGVSAALQGQGVDPPGAAISPASVTFPDTPQGSPSAAQQFTVTSTGGAALTLSAPSTSTADYYISGNDCPPTLAPGASCHVQVIFHPSATGLRAAALRFTTNTPDGQLSAGLSGNGNPPGVLSIAPGSLQFGTHVIGTSGPSQTTTVSNTGGTGIALGAVSVSATDGGADYAIQNDCPATLAPASSCEIVVSFSPTKSGDRPGTLTVLGDGAEASAVTTLDGAGVTPGSLAFSPASLAFGNVATDGSAQLPATVTNTGQVAVHLAAISVISGGGDFSVTGGSCAAGLTLAPGASCSLQITFQPTAQGAISGAVTIANDGTPPSVSASLAGNGTPPGHLAVSPGNLPFGNVATNTASPAQPIRLSNDGSAPISLGSPGAPGSGFSIASGCSSTLAAGASCTVQVVFRPAQRGPASGAVNLSWQGGSRSQPQTVQVALSGNGVNPGALAFAPSPLQFGLVSIGASASQIATVTNIGDLQVALGVPFTSNGYSVANGCGSVLAGGASCNLRISFSPSTRGEQDGLLTIGSADGSGVWTDSLQGAGAQPGSITASVASLAFPATVIGNASNPEAVTFTNAGDLAVTLNPPQSSSAEFVVLQAGSNCGASLAPNGGACTISLAFAPAARGDRTGTLTLAASNNGGPAAHVSLAGTGLTPAQLSFSPPSLDFASQLEQTRTKTPQTLTLQNTGDAPTKIGLPVLTGQYVLASGDGCVDPNTGLGVTLGGGASCSLSVQFQPTARGKLDGSVAIADVSGTPSVAASLHGRGLALTLDPATLTFDKPLLLGQSYTSPNLISITNLDRSQAISLQPLSITGDFAMQQSSCGETLAPDTACSLYISFTPTADGRRTGAFTVTLADGTETQTTQLVGIGLTPATDSLSTTSLAFPATAIGLSSPAQTVVVTNSGDAALTLITAVTTANNRPFSVANNCGPSLPGHSSCSLAVQFIPQSVGTVGGTLTITDAIGTQVVTLTGQGTLPPLSSQATPPLAYPASVDFGPFVVNPDPAKLTQQIVTITNLNRVQLAALNLSVDDPEYKMNSACTGSLDPGASCQVAISFQPTSAGVHPGTLRITGMVGTYAESTSVTLSGAGQDFALTLTNANANANNQQPGTVVITQGQEADFTITVTPLGDAAAYTSASTITIACSGTPQNSTCNAPATITVPPNGAAGTGVLRILTNGVASSGAHPASRWWPEGAALALLCPALFLRGEWRRRLLVAVAAVALLTAPMGCGVHASGVKKDAGASGSQTPTGTYTLTVTGSFPGAQRTATVQLVVQ